MRRKNAMQFNYDRQVSKQDPYEMDIDGFKGEYIVAKYLNIMVDFSINQKKNPVDLYTASGKSIDVKSTRNNKGDVYVTEYHRKSPCDFYILVVLDDTGGDIVGWVDKDELFEFATLIQGNHPSYRYDRNRLNNIKQF
jgi:hypothetical protein